MVGRPEAAAVRREELVDEEKVAFFVRAELEFGVGQEDAGLFRVLVGSGVKREAAVADLAEEGGAELLFGLSLGEREIVALFGLGGGGEDGFGELGCLEKIFG